MEFRKLRADEIDVRISMTKENGVQLLLYKDARCDMQILDETVGCMNWTRKHCRDNANCIVSIWDDEKKIWVDKEDTGTESNTEAEKGLASDSFKRACFNWGIGRELYTAPFMWVSADKCKVYKDQQGKWKCNDRFTVTDITYDGNRIASVSVKNASLSLEITYGNKVTDKVAEKPKKAEINASTADGEPIATITKEQKAKIMEEISGKFHTKQEMNTTWFAILKDFGITDMLKLPAAKFDDAIKRVDFYAQKSA